MLAALGFGRDTILLVTRTVPNAVPVANQLATELDADGRLGLVVVWSMSDPLFRAAVNDGVLRRPPENPTPEQATEAADRLKLGFVAMLTAFRDGDLVRHRIDLYRAGKLVWQDPDPSKAPDRAALEAARREGKITDRQFREATEGARYGNVAITRDGKLGLDDTVASIARTWREQLAAGPFRGQSERPARPTPEPAPGERPVVTDVPIVPKVRVVDNTQLRQEAAALSRDGKRAAAVNLLRDAIDAEPLDLERRVLLVTLLMQAGDANAAAAEARRAANLLPDRTELRAMAARAWLQAGNADEAQADLNEAVARDPEGLDTRLLLAEVALGRNQPADALEHLNKAIERGDNPEVRVRRALARTLLGDSEAAARDLAEAKPDLATDPMAAGARYAFALRCFDASDRTLGGEISSLIQRALVQRTAPEVAEGFDGFNRRIAARIRFLEANPVPPAHAASHERRVLAYKLLAQCLSDLGAFLDTGNEETLTDARINLGEALKQITAARDAFTAEVSGKPSHAGDRPT